MAGTETLGGGSQASDQKRRASNAVTCAGCGAWWTGTAAAHCGACHETFGGVGLFDRHRDQYGDRGRCVHPTEIKKGRRGETSSHPASPPMELRDGVWRGPEMTDEAKAKFRR